MPQYVSHSDDIYDAMAGWERHSVRRAEAIYSFRPDEFVDTSIFPHVVEILLGEADFGKAIALLEGASTGPRYETLVEAGLFDQHDSYHHQALTSHAVGVRMFRDPGRGSIMGVYLFYASDGVQYVMHGQDIHEPRDIQYVFEHHRYRSRWLQRWFRRIAKAIRTA